MAIRRPSLYSENWLYQDFLYSEEEGVQYRYLQVKWDGEVYSRISQSFDYSDPPFSGSEQKGGHIVAQIDYTVASGIVSITNWSVNWRDELPLRYGINYLANCLYPQTRYSIQVVQDEVYNQAGEAIQAPNRDPIAFWVSEHFGPLSNSPNTPLWR
jgi:hypothetical protein